MFVVHISNSPLVGSPGKISYLLNLKAEFSSVHYCVNDYPDKSPLNKKFIENSFVLSSKEFNFKPFFLDDLKKADIVHIHNEIPHDLALEIFSYAKNAQFIYQVHSPLREGPLYVDRSEKMLLHFDKKLVVAQYQPRLYQDYIMVPNIINSFASVNYYEPGESLKIMFSPSHSRGGRWNAKTDDRVEMALKAIQNIPGVEMIQPVAPLHPNTLLNLRRKSHISIDEILTGAFHQVSLEGLICGNITINGADTLSKLAFSQSYGSSFDEIPFVFSAEDDLFDLVLDYVQSPEKIIQEQEKTYAFALKYMNPNILIKEYIDVYLS